MKIVTFNAPAETITDKPMFRDALGRPEITPHNWISQQSRAGMPDDGLGIAARVVDAFASGDALAAVSVSCFTAAVCFSRVTVALFLLPFCRPPVFFPSIGVYFSSILDKFRQFNADIPGLRGHFGDVFRCSRQSQVFDAHKSREEGFRLFAVCRASRALVAAAALRPGDIKASRAIEVSVLGFFWPWPGCAAACGADGSGGTDPW